MRVLAPSGERKGEPEFFGHRVDGVERDIVLCAFQASCVPRRDTQCFRELLLSNTILALASVPTQCRAELVAQRIGVGVGLFHTSSVSGGSYANQVIITSR